MADTDPITGQWYQHLDKGQEFQVVAVDERTGTVEIQHYDGDLEELSLDDWALLEVEPIAPPEDWTGPLDRMDPDELDLSATEMSEEDWDEPLQEIHDETTPNPETMADEEGDDEWGEGHMAEELRPID